MKQRYRIFLPLIGAAVLLGAGLLRLIHERQLAQERRLYEGHSIGKWVELALAGHSLDPDLDATRMVSRIGAPAVPYLVDALDRLRENRIHELVVHWQIEFLPEWCRWYEMHPDVSGDAVAATQLLTSIGEAARAAVPAIIRSADLVHYWAYIEILDALAGLGPWPVRPFPGCASLQKAVTFTRRGRSPSLFPTMTR